MNRLLLVLACSVLVISLLSFTAAPTPASEAPNGAAVSSSQKRPDLSDRLEFTGEESNAAIARFGCDCLTCINAVRQLRNQPPLAH